MSTYLGQNCWMKGTCFNLPSRPWWDRQVCVAIRATRRSDYLQGKGTIFIPGLRVLFLPAWSPISLSACNKGNRRRLYAGKYCLGPRGKAQETREGMGWEGGKNKKNRSWRRRREGGGRRKNFPDPAPILFPAFCVSCPPPIWEPFAASHSRGTKPPC